MLKKCGTTSGKAKGYEYSTVMFSLVVSAVQWLWGSSLYAWHILVQGDGNRNTLWALRKLNSQPFTLKMPCNETNDNEKNNAKQVFFVPMRTCQILQFIIQNHTKSTYSWGLHVDFPWLSTTFLHPSCVGSLAYRVGCLGQNWPHGAFQTWAREDQCLKLHVATVAPLTLW